MKETVCVTGGSGGIGHALLDQLLGVYRVKALFRRRDDITDYWERRGSVVVLGDLDDQDALSELVAGTRFVFHCAALVAPAPYAVAHAINVDGTRRLAWLAAKHGCQRFVHFSSVAVYSATPPDADYTEWVDLREDEGMPTYALTKLRSERALKEVAKDSALEFTILRPTCVYGPRTKPYTQVPIDLIRKGLPVIVGDGGGVIDAVYVDDVAGAAVLAATSPQARGETFNIGHETVTLTDFYGHYGRMLNRSCRRVPLGVVRSLARLLHKIPGKEDVAKGAAFLVSVGTNTRRFPHTKAASLIGYAPRTTLMAGMLETRVWAKQHWQMPTAQYSLDGYGPLPFRPAAVVHPATEEDLTDITRIARTANLKVKAIGALHSLCPIPETDGICVVLDKYDRLLNVDGQLVTVQAGMTLRALNAALAEVNLALPVSGSIAEQTVAGAISTATHGGSIHYGSISDYVESLTLVRADGSIVRLDRSHPHFHAATVSVGMLGIISTITFRSVPAFRLQSRSTVRKAEEVIAEFDEINRQSLYTDMLYFPVTDEIEILAVNAAEHDAVSDMPPAPALATPIRHSGGNPLVRRLAVSTLKALASRVERYPRIQRAFTRRTVGSTYQTRTGRSDWVLAFGGESSGRSPAVMQDMEVAVPYTHARTALTLLRNHFMTRKKYPLFPIHIRCSAPSDAWLSPAYQREVCWFECWQYRRDDTLFAAIHELLQPFGYRFHWGKETRANLDYTKRHYPKWDDFIALRDEWDPTGMFMNSYMARWMHPAAPSRLPAEAALAMHEDLVEEQKALVLEARSSE